MFLSDVRGVNPCPPSSISKLHSSVIKCAITTPESLFVVSMRPREKLAPRAEPACQIV